MIGEQTVTDNGEFNRRKIFKRLHIPNMLTRVKRHDFREVRNGADIRWFAGSVASACNLKINYPTKCKNLARNTRRSLFAK